MKRIALVGDHCESIIAHRAIPVALEMAVKHARVAVGWEWRHSRSLAYGQDSASEEYHCSYGRNPAYAERLVSGPLSQRLLPGRFRKREPRMREQRIVNLAGGRHRT